MSIRTKHIVVESNKAKVLLQELRDKKVLVEKCLEIKDYKTLKDNKIVFVSPFAL